MQENVIGLCTLNISCRAHVWLQTTASPVVLDWIKTVVEARIVNHLKHELKLSTARNAAPVGSDHLLKTYTRQYTALLESTCGWYGSDKWTCSRISPFLVWACFEVRGIGEMFNHKSQSISHDYATRSDLYAYIHACRYVWLIESFK